MYIETNNTHERENNIMRVEFLDAINAVCKESEIDLKLSDIIDVSDYDTEIVMLVRNDQEMFEFRITAVLYDDIIEMSITEVAESPYSCDSFNASYFIKDKTLTIH